MKQKIKKDNRTALYLLLIFLSLIFFSCDYGVFKVLNESEYFVEADKLPYHGSSDYEYNYEFDGNNLIYCTDYFNLYTLNTQNNEVSLIQNFHYQICSLKFYNERLYICAGYTLWIYDPSNKGLQRMLTIDSWIYDIALSEEHCLLFTKSSLDLYSKSDNEQLDSFTFDYWYNSYTYDYNASQQILITRDSSDIYSFYINIENNDIQSAANDEYNYDDFGLPFKIFSDGTKFITDSGKIYNTSDLSLSYDSGITYRDITLVDDYFYVISYDKLIKFETVEPYNQVEVLRSFEHNPIRIFSNLDSLHIFAEDDEGYLAYYNYEL